MQIIKFVESDLEFPVLLEKQADNRIRCTFSNEEDTQSAPLLEGFVGLNEHKRFVQSDYTDYKYVYKREDDGLTFIITTDDSDIYIEPQTPEPQPYISTIKDLKKVKIDHLSNVCKQNIINGVDIEVNGKIEHYSYKDEDQMNIKELYDIAMRTNSPVYYHPDGESCRLYMVEQIMELYSTVTMNKTHHTTYFNQLKLYVETLNTKEDIEAVEYGQELTGKYLETYNTVMEQATFIINT